MYEGMGFERAPENDFQPPGTERVLGYRLGRWRQFPETGDRRPVLLVPQRLHRVDSTRAHRWDESRAEGDGRDRRRGERYDERIVPL